jgi:hypothetical protein
MPASAQDDFANNEGRGRFLIQQIPLGVWYGVGIGQFLSNDHTTGKATAAISLVSASAFYFVPMAIIWNKQMTNAQAHLSVALGYRGIPVGFALGDLINLGRRRVHYDQSYYYEFNWRPRMGLMVATSLGAQVGGYFLARDMTLGRATLVTAYSDVGWIDGMLAYGALAIATEDQGLKSSPFFLAGLAGGTALGWWRQQHLDCTEGQVTFGRTAATLGGAIPPALIWSMSGWGDEGRQPAWLMTSAIVGSAAAVYFAEQAVRDAPLSAGDGYIIIGCTAGGALMGAGLGYLFSDEYSSDAMRPVVGVATLGAVGGFYLGGRLTSVWPRTTALNRRPAHDAWARVHVNFGAAAGAVSSYVTSRQFSAPNLVTVEF